MSIIGAYHPMTGKNTCKLLISLSGELLIVNFHCFLTLKHKTLIIPRQDPALRRGIL